MRAILLLHGFATSRMDFARIVPILMTRYDEVCFPNLPSHAENVVKESLDSARILDFVLETFDGLKSRHQFVDVIGYSMGGALATFLASQRQIERLILLAPANKFLAPAFVLNTVKSMIGKRNRQKSEKISKDINAKARKDTSAGRIVCAESLSAKEMLVDLGIGIKLFAHIIRRYTPKNLSQFRRVIKDCNCALKEINVPTLIIWGKPDQLVPFSSIKHIVSCCRHDTTRVIIYDDISHIMLYSQAHYRITDEILRFLEQTSPPLLCLSDRTNKTC